MSRFWKTVFAAVIIAAATGWWITAPTYVDAARFSALTGDTERGKPLFIAAGCASCHHAPGAEDKLILSGGMAFPSEFGTFYAPNISPDPEAGIGGWSLPEFANAVLKGVSPDGQHYYPAFPYGSYGKMRDQDVADIFAYLRTLPPAAQASKSHEVGFPFNIRRSLGGWKWLFSSDAYVMDAPPELERGRYLVETLAHCGECHTPRNALGGLDHARWMGGAPDPSGKGTVPALTPDRLDWSAEDIAYYLESGFTPDYDSVGGHMSEVVANFAQLSVGDRQAVAAYVKALPAP